MIKKIIDQKIENAILEILEERKSAMSIRLLTKEINIKYGIKVSSLVVKKHLEHLLKTGQIEEN